MAATDDFYETLNEFSGGGLFGSGPDLAAEIEISVAEAYTGGRCRVSLDAAGFPGGPRGDLYLVVRLAPVDVPPGSSSGRRFRLPGRGLPNPAGRPGDLYAEVAVMVPPATTPGERDLFAQLARRSTFDPRVSLPDED